MKAFLVSLLIQALALFPSPGTIVITGPVYFPAAGGGLADPTILWNKMNDGSGTTATSAVGPNITTDAAWSSSTQASAFCLDFNGTSQDGQTASTLTYGVSTITVTFWLYANSWSAGTAKQILESNTDVDSGDDQWSIYNADDVIYVYFTATAGKVYLAHITHPAASAWHHYAFVFANTASGSVVSYLDGSLVTTTVDFQNLSAGANFQNQKLYQMARASASRFFPGRMDDLRVYNLGLTAGNISTIYTGNAQ